MILIDSNIIIYGSQPAYQYVRDYLAQQEIAVSKITLIEVVGYHALAGGELQKLEQLFAECYQFKIDDSIVKQAITLRQQRKMALGDAIIAATALEHKLLLVTANEKDFDWISDINIYNPIH